MAHSRRGFRGRGISDSQRRKKSWLSVKIAVPGTGVAASTFVTSIVLNTPATGATQGAFTSDVIALISDPTTALGDELSTLPEECTILRSRGSLVFPKNTPFATSNSLPSDQYVFGFGVTDIRGIVGGSSPLPVSDADWDGWMFLRQSALPPVEANSGIIDVKAMRKVKTGDALFFAAQAVSGDTVATPAGLWQFDMRLLILLP